MRKIMPLDWRMDVDYLRLLSPADRKWMIDFLYAHYTGAKNALSKNYYSRDSFRTAWRERHAMRRDSLNHNYNSILEFTEALGLTTEDYDECSQS